MKKILLTMCIAVTVVLNGCSNNENIIKSKVTVQEYSKTQYESVFVQKGDLVPQVNLKLKAPKYRLVSYNPIYDEMTVEKVYVSKGEHVKKGERLVSFKSGDINDQIIEYQKQLEQHMLMLEHYKTLQDMADKNSRETGDKKEKENFIYKRDKYDVDIQMINESIVLDNMYIQELQGKLASYSICAEEAGTVYKIVDGLESAIVNTDKWIIAVAYGNDDFEAECSDTYGLEIGQTYTGLDGKDEYQLVLSSIEEKTDESGEVSKLLKFKAPNGSDFGYADEMVLSITMPAIQNVLYVPTKCINKLNDELIVYKLDDKGYRSVAFVTCGEEIDGQTIILSGLNEGDRVVIE